MAAPNIQIMGHKKCADTRKAVRFFKERGIVVHERDLARDGIQPGELKKIKQAVGGSDALAAARLIDRDSKEFQKRNLKYLGMNLDEAILKYPLILRTPIVRNGAKATVGYDPETWQAWLAPGESGGA